MPKENKQKNWETSSKILVLFLLNQVIKIILAQIMEETNMDSQAILAVNLFD